MTALIYSWEKSNQFEAFLFTRKMKESTRFCVLFAVTFTVVSFVSREVASYPMMESGANNGPYAAAVGVPAPLQPNPDANIKDLSFSPAAQNALDNR